MEELESHLYSLPHLPDAIPYVTSYYKRNWGFCLTHNQRKTLKKGIYQVFIDASHNGNGVLNYGDLVLPSTLGVKDEILISSYLCHPSMANNELSGPVVAIFLANLLRKLPQRKYNYRFVFIPETIGSIVYLNAHLKELQENVKAGFVLSCVGDNRAYSLVKSPSEDSLADRVALSVLQRKENFKSYDFTQRGSDERQYCSPLVNLGVVGVCRSKYGEFKEYHTSLDNLSIMSAESLADSLYAMLEICLSLEINAKYQSTNFCEPNLGKRGLYHTTNTPATNANPNVLVHFLAFCDGQRDVIEISRRLWEKFRLLPYEYKNCIETLLGHKLIQEVEK